MVFGINIDVFIWSRSIIVSGIGIKVLIQSHSIIVLGIKLNGFNTFRYSFCCNREYEAISRKVISQRI